KLAGSIRSQMKPRRRKAEINLSKARSAITNGKCLFLSPDIDHRSSWARRLRDLAHDIGEDIGPAASLSAQQMLVRRASMLALQAELQAQAWATNGGEASPKSLDAYQRITNTLRRTLQTLSPGLQRIARPVQVDYSKIAADIRREDRRRRAAPL